MVVSKFSAIVLAIVMVLMYAVPMSVLAEDEAPAGLTLDGNIAVTDLANGDEVNFYKIIKWVDGSGWALESDFSSLSTKDVDTDKDGTVDQSVFDRILEGTLSEADTAKIKACVNSGVAAKYNKTASSKKVEVEDPEAGLYMAIVTPVEAGTIYNPMFVVSDYNDENDTYTISSNATYTDTGKAKKGTVTVGKTADEVTMDLGDEVTFTVTTTIPLYSKSFTAPFFNVSDKVSDNLELIKTPADSWITVSSGSVKSTVQSNDNKSFKVTFDSADIAALQAEQAVTITYKAKMTGDAASNVNEETNEVKVEFSNNPLDASGKSVVKDETKHYTFTLDGTLFGNSNYTTSEIVKVGLNADGTPNEEVINTYSNETTHAALEGAVFGLYTDADCKTLYTNTSFDGEVTTDDMGHMLINGLDAGTYYLKEISAPNGYIKDPDTHTIVITANTSTDTVTEYSTDGTAWISAEDYGKLTDAEKANYYSWDFDVEKLDSYTVKVDNTTSTYTMTLEGPSITEVTEGDQSTELINKKGAELPSTGGIGTTIFYILGAILVLGAGVLLVTRRRMRASEE